MIRRLSTWLIVAVLAGAFVAGCGSSSNSTSSGQTASTSSTAAGATSTSASTTASDQATQQTVAACKQVVQSVPAIPASEKAKLEASCDQAGGAGVSKAAEAAKRVCVEAVNSSSIPSVIKAQGLAACSKIK